MYFCNVSEYYPTRVQFINCTTREVSTYVSASCGGAA